MVWSYMADIPLHIQWLERAKSSYAISKQASIDGVCPEDLCFQAQQGAEKALKALLAYCSETMPRTHSISVLIELAEKHVEVPAQIRVCVELSDYAVQTRYPGEYHPVEKEEYEQAVSLANGVIEWVSAIIENTSTL